MSSAVTPIVGYQEITEKCTLPEKIVSKKENEIWLIRAPKDFPETDVEKIKMNLKDDNSVSEFKIGDRTFSARQGDKEALCQVFFCYKDTNKGVIPGRPFAREIIITEKFSNEKSYASFDGAGHDIPKVEQLTGLKLHYIPPGAMIPKEPSSNLVPDLKKEKKIKKEKKEKHEKHEKHKKHKKSPK